MDSEDLISRIEGELGSTTGRDAAAPLDPPPRVADHELVRRIGSGSYGEVWLASNVTGQWRAVKVVARSRFSSDRPYEREFSGVRRFEPISRLHSGLVHVLHVGRDDSVGAFYYVMELADASEAASRELGSGLPASAPSDHPREIESRSADYSPRTLRSDLKSRGRLSVAEAVALGVELSGALGHIHRHGLVHRDVKPSNVIFVHGRPKLADLGLVTSTSEARSFVGTEGFIPPEGPGTAKADLFALGRLLYEAVTGKDRCEFPELPADLDSWPNREEFLEFNEVVTQLCAPDPARRYANAAEVAGDLNLILAGRSVRRSNGIERRLRLARRIAVMALLGLAVATGAVWLQQSRQREAEDRAAHERSLRERAEGAERAGQRQLYAALLEQARATVRGGELGQRVKALDAVRRAAAITNSAELRREALMALALPDLRWERDLPFGREFVARVPDAALERIALCRGRGPIEIRAISNLAVLATLTESTNLSCYGIVWSRDGRYLAAKRDYRGDGSKGDLEVWAMSEPPRRVLLIREVRYNAWSFHPERAELLTAVQSDTLVNWDLESGTEIARRAIEVTPEYLKYSPDAKSVAAAYQSTEGWGVSIHNLGQSEPRAAHVFRSTGGMIEWHPRGRWLAITDFGGAVHLMDATNGTLRLLGRHRAEAVSAAFDASGDYLITGGWERAFICWDLRAMQRAFGIEVEGYVSQFKADGSALAVRADSAVQLYAFERPEVVRDLTMSPGSRVRHAAFSPDGRWLAASTDASVSVCDLATGQTAAEACAGPRPFWNREGTKLFGSSSSGGSGRGGSVNLWQVRPADPASGPPVLERQPMPLPARFNSFSVVANRVVWTSALGSQITGMDGLLPVDNAWTPTVRGINGQSPDGRWLGIYAPDSSYLHLYKMPELAHIATITNLARISGFSFSPSSGELAVASRGQLEIYRTASWQRVRGTTIGVGISYVGILFQPDERGLWLAASFRDGGLHDARTFELLLPLPIGHLPIALSDDGRQLAVSVDARRLHVWDLARARTRLRELGLDWTASGP